MKAFITGIAGFTGKHLTELLRKNGVQVTGIDLSKSKQFYQADLRDKDGLEKILKKERPDYIFHLASPLIRSSELMDESLQKNLAVDLFGSVNLIEAAAKLKKKPKLLITGTNAEYRPKKTKFKESDKLEPVTAYGLSKLTQEMVSRKLAESYGLDLIYTRTFHLIGPGQSPGFAVTDFCYQIAKIEQGKTKPELRVGNLKIERDFTDAREAVKAYWLLMEKGKPGEVYNVCSDKAYSIKEILDKLQQLSQKRFKIAVEQKKLRKNDPLVIGGDNSKLRRTTGWKREISLEQSLKDTLGYWRKEVKA